MDSKVAAAAMIERVRARPWGLAVAAIDGSETEIHVDPGKGPMSDSSVFQIGSISKAFTGVLLATCVERGEVALDLTVGSVLGERAGKLAGATLLSLATHRSGLPKLPGNLKPSDLANPYSGYSHEDLVSALSTVELPSEERFEYSNFGFMLLGLVLEEITGSSLPQILADRIFQPLELNSAGCPPGSEGRIPGYSGNDETVWWTNLPAFGEIGMNIRDLARFLSAHVDLDTGDSTLDKSLATAATIHKGPPNPMGLGWHHQGGGWWHNGGTGGFRSFCAFHRGTRTAVALLANSGDADVLDRVGFAVLTDMVRARASR